MHNNKDDSTNKNKGTNTIVIGLMGAMFEEIDTVKTLLDPSTIKIHEQKHGNRTYVEGVVNLDYEFESESKRDCDGRVNKDIKIKLVIVHSRLVNLCTNPVTHWINTIVYSKQKTSTF